MAGMWGYPNKPKTEKEHSKVISKSKGPISAIEKARKKVKSMGVLMPSSEVSELLGNKKKK